MFIIQVLKGTHKSRTAHICGHIPWK